MQSAIIAEIDRRQPNHPLSLRYASVGLYSSIVLDYGEGGRMIKSVFLLIRIQVFGLCVAMSGN